ncbi:hypothetical protein AQAU111925_13210 [Aquirufa aurantiipilula]
MPALIVIEELVTAVPVAGVNVKVPVPAVPEYLIQPEISATPLTNLSAANMTSPPTKPEIVPDKLVVTVI